MLKRFLIVALIVSVLGTAFLCFVAYSRFNALDPAIKVGSTVASNAFEFVISLLWVIAATSFLLGFLSGLVSILVRPVMTLMNYLFQVGSISLPKDNSKKILRRLVRLILTEEEEENIKGDLDEEFKEMAAKHGARYAKLWYYKQVAASAWPLARKAVGWGLLAWVEEWIRRRV